MKSKDILNRLEKLINDILNKVDNSEIGGKIEIEDNSNRAGIKKIFYLLMQLFLNILKTPFKIVADYLKDEIIITIKKDFKLYMLIMGLMGVLFVFFSIVWLFISVAVGVYFYDKGYTILISIIYSIGVQAISFILIGLLALILSKKLKSLKILKKLIK